MRRGNILSDLHSATANMLSVDATPRQYNFAGKFVGTTRAHVVACLVAGTARQFSHQASVGMSHNHTSYNSRLDYQFFPIGMIINPIEGIGWFALTVAAFDGA